jgi:hypothetical protein
MPIFTGIERNVDALGSLIWGKMFIFIDSADKPNNRNLHVMLHVARGSVLLFSMIFVSVLSDYIPTGYLLTIFASRSMGQGIFRWGTLFKSNNRFDRIFQEIFIAEVQQKQDEDRNAILQKVKRSCL